MKAWQCDAARPTPGLTLTDIETPQPGPGQILVRVAAVGVTPSELIWYPSTHTREGADRPAAVPGHEFSGTIAALGADVNDKLQIGDAVLGMNDWFADGATAEYCLSVPNSIAPLSAGLSHEQAATLPIAALTAWQGLIDRAKLQPDETVLIHGAAGAVGIIAVQLARWRRARVVATASAKHRELLLSLGCSAVVDYRTQRFETVAPSVDVVFDCVGGETLERSWAVLGKRGRLVTVAAAGETARDERTKNAFFIVEPNRTQLVETQRLIAAGHVKPFVDAVLPFNQADQAYLGRSFARQGFGKTVVSLST